MLALRASLTDGVPHCGPSDREEDQKCMCLPDECMQQLIPLENDSDLYEFYKRN